MELKALGPKNDVHTSLPADMIGSNRVRWNNTTPHLSLIDIGSLKMNHFSRLEVPYQPVSLPGNRPSQTETL
jgi:hypothetical protein